MADAYAAARALLAAAPRPLPHADHVRIAFELLSRHDFDLAAAALCAGLKQVAAEAGHPEAFHHTKTVAFLALIGERAAAMRACDYNAFARACPELMDRRILERWYTPQQLASDAARRSLILPQPALTG
jgi:hypothetical protein